ncbi:MAG: RNA polymerase sigma factor [Patescibacteria group bacterium]
MDTVRETEAIAACQAGDMERFGELYDDYVDRMYAFVYARTLHRETAEDLTSAVFIKALGHIGRYRGGSFRAWLYRIARHTIIDHYRTAKAVIPLDVILQTSREPRTENSSEQLALLSEVRQYLSGLSPRHRDVVLLRIWDGLSYREIAQIAGMTEGQCKMQISRVLRQTRIALAAVATLIFIITITI